MSEQGAMWVKPFVLNEPSQQDIEFALICPCNRDWGGGVYMTWFTPADLANGLDPMNVGARGAELNGWSVEPPRCPDYPECMNGGGRDAISQAPAQEESAE